MANAEKPQLRIIDRMCRSLNQQCGITCQRKSNQVHTGQKLL